MFGLVVRFDLKEGAAAAFDELVERTTSLIRSEEPETLIYTCHEVEGTPTARLFYELYRDREAFEQHERQDYIRRFLAEREQYLTGVRVEFLDLQRGKGVPGLTEVTS